MFLNEKLKDVVLEDIKHNDAVTFRTYAKNNADLLGFLYGKGIIDDIAIDEALEEVVFGQARQDYNMMTGKSRGHTIYADHILRPEFFAYALSNNQFTEREIQKIPFDHGEDAETYSKLYGKSDLISILRKELLNLKDE